MRLYCWGTRGNVAVPGPETIQVGGNTSCYQLDLASGARLIFDCGSGIIEYGASLSAAAVAHSSGAQRSAPTAPPTAGTAVGEHHIFISHLHWDHVLGFPFFRPIHRRGATLHLYSALASEQLSAQVADLFDGTYSPLRDIANLGATLHFHQIPEAGLELGDARIRAQPLDHSGVCHGFRVDAGGKSFCYATDHEARPGAANDAVISFASGADLLLHDAQYTAEEYTRHVGWGHSSLEACLDNGRRAGCRRLLLTHHDPAYTDEFLSSYVGALIAAHPDAPPFELARDGHAYEF